MPGHKTYRSEREYSQARKSARDKWVESPILRKLQEQERGYVPMSREHPKISALDYARWVGMENMGNLRKNRGEIINALAGLMRARVADRSELSRTMDKHADETTVDSQTSFAKREFLKNILNVAETKSKEKAK
jgi:hypothetical protein